MVLCTYSVDMYGMWLCHPAIQLHCSPAHYAVLVDVFSSSSSYRASGLCAARMRQVHPPLRIWAPCSTYYVACHAHAMQHNAEPTGQRASTKLRYTLGNFGNRTILKSGFLSFPLSLCLFSVSPSPLPWPSYAHTSNTCTHTRYSFSPGWAQTPSPVADQATILSRGHGSSPPGASSILRNSVALLRTE